jgi:hypothetical protein
MTIVNGDVLRVALRLSDQFGSDVVQVWHVQVTDRGTDDEDTFLENVSVYMLTGYVPYKPYFKNTLLSVDTRIDRVGWVDGKETVLEAFPIIAEPSTLGGTSTSENNPPQVSPLIAFRTAGIKSLGRKFLWACTENALDSTGALEAAALAAIVSVGEYYTASISMGAGAGAIRPVIHSLRANGWVPLLSAVVKSVVSTWRKRKPHVGS